MSETTIKPIHSEQSSDPRVLSKIHGSSPGQALEAQRLASTEQEKPYLQEGKKGNQNNDLSNISLQFRVDEETQKLTVFIVDKNSKRVIRSIPPGELHKLHAGDLLKLTA